MNAALLCPLPSGRVMLSTWFSHTIYTMDGSCMSHLIPVWKRGRYTLEAVHQTDQPGLLPSIRTFYWLRA